MMKTMTRGCERARKHSKWIIQDNIMKEMKCHVKLMPLKQNIEKAF